MEETTGSPFYFICVYKNLIGSVEDVDMLIPTMILS